MSLEVIGAGFGRTGTASLKMALEALGLGPCHHMMEVMAHPDQVAYWRDLAAGREVSWDEVFAGYRSQVDWPGAHYWRELSIAFPTAKILLSVRPELSWWKSFSATIGVILKNHKTLAMPPHMVDMMAVNAELIEAGTFHGASHDRAAALAAYRLRIEQVRNTIPPERLLIFDVAEGWEPLCRFLGKPAPDVPFPRSNSTEEFWEKASEAPQ